MPRRPPFTQDRLRAIVAESSCWSDVARALGLRLAGGNPKTIKKYVALWGIPTDHFDPNIGRKRAGAARRLPLREILVERSAYPRGHLKQRLYTEGLKQRLCELCGQGEIWRGCRMSLILDHINGVHDDNRLENLRIVCPNCAATFETHCGRNPVLAKSRACAVCEREFMPSYPQHRYCSRTCVGEANKATLSGVPQPARRRVERPSYSQLSRELAETNYSAVGRKYGVSDNAVRKWIRAYEALPAE